MMQRNRRGGVYRVCACHDHVSVEEVFSFMKVRAGLITYMFVVIMLVFVMVMFVLVMVVFWHFERCLSLSSY